jgi:hypothetical protein
MAGHSPGVPLHSMTGTPFTFSTMITTRANTEFLPVARLSQPEDQPYWTFWGRWKSNFAEFWSTSPITRMCCCVDPEVHLDAQLRRRQHEAVRESLLYTLDYRGDTSIITATMNDLLDEGHVMLQDAAPIPARSPNLTNPATLGPTFTTLTVYDPATHHAWSQPQMPAPVVQRRRNLTSVKFVPRFTAAVIVELRSRLGQLSESIPGNVLIVEREALRLMRKYSVREVDAVAHLPSIISCYFREDLHYRVETSVSRMSKFQRWLVGETQPKPSFTPLA